ncbi:MAG: hypothetical protein JKY61_06220 [Planctomycetes bacterium]|nr:hypothetical protein [Planctomycetota bacterium]
MWLVTPILVGLAVFAFDRSERPDRIVLKDGNEIVCRIMFEDEGRVLFKAKKKVESIALSKVQEVRSVERSSRAFLDRLSSLSRTSVAELAGLALWAEEHGLPGEAKALWLRVVLLDATDAEAWGKLDSKRTKTGWRLRLGNRTFTADEFRGSGRDWRYAIEIPTAHFLVKANGDLVNALDIAIELESIYSMYYERLGQQIELYPFEWIPEIRIHGGGKRAPQPPVSGVDAWYDTKSNVLMVHGDQPQANHVRRAALDMMIENSFRMALGNRAGTLPVWAHEGLANEFVLALRSDSHQLKLKGGEPYQAWFEAQARMKKKLSIRRVFGSSGSDYGGGTNKLGFRAASYTLVFYLMNNENDQYRKAFFDYLRAAFRGKGSLSTFERAFPVPLETLSKEWNTFIHETAGV